MFMRVLVLSALSLHLVAGVRRSIQGMESVRQQVDASKGISIQQQALSLEPVTLKAARHDAQFFAYETYDFAPDRWCPTADMMRAANPCLPADYAAADNLMKQLGAQQEFQAFLTKLSAALQSGSQGPQNEKGKELAEQFNKEVHQQGKMKGWKVTFYSELTRTRARASHSNGGGGVDFSGHHFLKIRPESDNTFLERHANEFCAWDRACCCKESAQKDCKYKWSDGKCCKFKFGNTDKYGCKMNWINNSKEKVEDGKCNSPQNGPQPKTMCWTMIGR